MERCSYLKVIIYGSDGFIEEEHRKYLNGVLPLVILFGDVRKSHARETSKKLAYVSQVTPKRAFKEIRRTNNQRKKEKVA